VQALKYCILTLALIISVGTDLSHQEIPDLVSLGSSGLLAVINLACLNWNGIIGGALLFGLLFLIAVASRGGMGGGDIKLGLAIGLALGWKLGLAGLVLAFIIGGVLAIFKLLRGYKKQALPFAPFLAAGATVVMLYGEELIDMYISFSLFLWRW